MLPTAHIMVKVSSDMWLVGSAGRLVERAPPHKLGRYKHGVGEACLPCIIIHCIFRCRPGGRNEYEVIPDGASR